MPTHREQQILPYRTDQLFDLVADIEHYPDFLPWCRAARVLNRHENSFEAELVISFKHFTESYISQVTLTPPAKPGAHARIDVKMLSGPFEHLINQWEFTPVGAGTRIDFFLDFRFRSKLLDTIIGKLFSSAVEKMVGAFRKRAEALYQP